MTAAGTEPELRQVVPACRLVTDRMLRRILHELIDNDRPVLVNTHLPWWVRRGELGVVEDLDPQILAGADDPILLLVERDDRSIYPRLLLHAVVYRRVAESIEAGVITPQSVEAAFREAAWDYESDARHVLTADHFIPVETDWSNFFPRFVATVWVWIETEPQELSRVFPSAPDPEVARAALAKLFDTASLPTVEMTRPEREVLPTSTNASNRPGLAERAERAEQTGNYVRAAICWYAVGNKGRASAVVRDGLMGILAPALKLDASASRAWAEACLPLLGPAGQGPWPHAAKALYDLQKLGLQLSGELFAVDPLRWAKSFGRQSMKQPLVRALPVLRHRALTNVRRHVGKAALSAEAAEPLVRLIDAARHIAETDARSDFCPRVVTALDAVQFVPTDIVERIARDKLAAELAERACDRGYLRFGDLRDAIARNNLKMPDLRGPIEFIAGDQLLKADKLLADSLAGVYHSGEIYLRGIQRASSLAFGTVPGRLLSKYVALPFGGAFLTLEFAQHMVHAGHNLYKFTSKILAPKPVPVMVQPSPVPDVTDAEESEGNWTVDDFVQVDRTEAVQVAKVVFTSTPEGPHLVTWPILVGLGVVFLALLYWSAFRQLIGRGLAAVGLGLRALFYDLPLAVWQCKPVRTIRRHPITRWVNRRLGTGFLVAVLVAIVLGFFGASPGRIARGAALWFALVSFAKLLPIGRQLEDRIATTLSDAWKMVRVNFLLGTLEWIVWVFREFAARVERALYAGDEWFRFREGQSKPSYRLKVVLGCVWFPVAYVVRFAFNLLLEPQVNPVKHFPVVTVSHKVLFTSLIPVSDATGIPEATLGILFTGVPGIFGFLAWELRENWRLYAANRPAVLRPIRLGHHGETMRGLLRPGFHSGTVPKQFKTIRKQLRRMPGDRNGYAISKAEHELHHLEQAIRRFVDREFLPLLRSAKAWRGVETTPGPVHFTNTSAEVELLSGPEEPIHVTFHLRDGAIVGHVDPKVLSSVEPERVETLTAAVRGFITLGAAVPDPDIGPAFTWDEWVKFWKVQCRSPQD